MVVVVISGFVFLQAAAVGRWLAAVNDGGAMCVSCFMQVVASLTVDLDNWAVAADNIVDRYSSWWLYFGVVSVGRGHGVAAMNELRFPFIIGCFGFNSCVKRSIGYYMYVEDTKC